MILPALTADVDHARAFVRSEVSQAVAGKPFLAAVELRMDPHWHVYWRNPGDSGVPTTVEWKAPKGWKVEPLEYQTPARFAPGGIAAYGYERTALFLARVTPNATGGTLSASAKWLVCKEACLPGSAILAQPIRIGKTARPSPAASILLAAYRALPQAAQGWTFTAHQGSKTVVLSARSSANLPTGAAQFFPLQSGIVDHAVKALATLTPGGFVLKMNVSPFPEKRTRLQGVLVAPPGKKWPGGSRALLVDAGLEKGETR